MTRAYPFYLAGQAVQAMSGEEVLSVSDKFTGEVAFKVATASRTDMDAAIESAVEAATPMRRLPAHQRRLALLHIARRLEERQEELAHLMVVEVGKPIKDARVEVNRARDTFRLAAEACMQMEGTYLPLDGLARGEGYDAFIKRVPIGPCGFITPFNFPLNLVAHKVAPAIAVGCTFVLKPAPQAPVSAIVLAEILAEITPDVLPRGAFSVLACDVEVAKLLVEDERIKLLSFTGSSAVGWKLKSQAGKKKVVLELGGNAACVVDDGLSSAAIDFALQRITFGAFYQAGQSCISVQRLFVHETIYEVVKQRLVESAAQLKLGDPRNEDTIIGPLISNSDVERIEQWVQEAVTGGAHVLCGGRRIDQRFYPATIVEDVPQNARLMSEEVFGPVLVISSFSRFEQALADVNASRYGLQAGVFTSNMQNAQQVWDELEVGGVIINDVPSVRIDSMPYGGVKDSGTGREGVRYAMQEMSELRTMVVKRATE